MSNFDDIINELDKILFGQSLSLTNNDILQHELSLTCDCIWMMEQNEIEDCINRFYKTFK